MFIKKTLSLLYSISAEKYTTGTVNHKKKSLDLNLVMMIKHVISYIRYIHDDIFIILYIDRKVHRWRSKSQKKNH